MIIEKIYISIKENFIYFAMFILFLYSSIYINSNLFILSIGFDGIFNAVQFSKYYIKDLSESHIIKNIPDIYNINTISRYEYYLFINCIAFILLPLKLFIRTIFIYVVIVPPILYKINISNYGQYIKNKKNLFLREFLSKHISKYIEKHSNSNFKIHYSEIIQLLSIENDIENIFWIILKNLLIILGIGYLKRNYSNISYNVIKKFYTYKTGVKISSISVQEAKDYIKNVINNKEWFKLYDVQFTNCLRIIYNENTNGSYLYSLQFKILYFFSLWSFGFILPLYTIPLLFLSFEIYRTNKPESNITNKPKSNTINKPGSNTINKRVMFVLVNILFSFILALLIRQEILLISFITVFGYPLLFNDLTFSIMGEIWKKKQFIINVHKSYDFMTFAILLISFLLFTTTSTLLITTSTLLITTSTLLITTSTLLTTTSTLLTTTSTLLTTTSTLTTIGYSTCKIQVYHIKLFIIYLLLIFINNFSISSILINSYILHIINNMINYYINSKRIYIDENDYSIIFINKMCLKEVKDDIHKKEVKDDSRITENVKELVYTMDNSYYNFSIKSSQLEESMIVFK